MLVDFKLTLYMMWLFFMFFVVVFCCCIYECFITHVFSMFDQQVVDKMATAYRSICQQNRIMKLRVSTI